MGKTPSKGEGGPRRAKAPRLDLLALAAEVVDSAGGEAAAPGASNLRNDAAVGTSGSNRCSHIPEDWVQKTSISWWLTKAGMCEGCQLEKRSGKARPEETSILMCLDCGRHFCSGVGAIGYQFGHSRDHAKSRHHWVAALYGDSEKGYCFNCNAEVGLVVEHEIDGGHVIGLGEICDIVSGLPKIDDSWLLPLPSVRWTKINPSIV